MSSDTLLALEDVSKQFNGLTVLSDVNFSVREGEILGLVGPNGSGKTTAINLISASIISMPATSFSADDPSIACRPSGACRSASIAPFRCQSHFVR